jgi:hypothetical protein
MRSAAFLDTEPNWLRKPSDADEAGRGKSNLEVVHRTGALAERSNRLIETVRI